MKRYNINKRLFITTGLIQLLFISMGAIAAGIGFIIDPTGQGLQIPLQLLENTPFDDFFIPGLFLLSVNGIGSLIGAILSFTRHRYAGAVAMILGIILVIWIITQAYWIGFSWLQPLYFGLGVLEFVLGYSLHTKYFKEVH